MNFREKLLTDISNIIFFLLANPSRDHVFHITFPKEWKHTDISQLFSPFGKYCIDTNKTELTFKLTSDTIWQFLFTGGGYISWLSDTSAYIGLYRRDQASIVMQALAKQTICKIQKYSNHQASLQTNVSLEDRKRKLSSPEWVIRIYIISQILMQTIWYTMKSNYRVLLNTSGQFYSTKLIFLNVTFSGFKFPITRLENTVSIF